jgi:four helix bundle protein
MQDFKKLTVWKKAHETTLAIYKVTNSFPKDEVYGLTSQIRRACVSIPSNIAEGCGKEGNKDLSNFLQIALGSASELEYQLLLAEELKYLQNTEYVKLNNQVNEVKKMLVGLIQKTRA